jgi:putative alpha-1,2-mannosidase
MTSTTLAGILKFTFNQEGKGNILITLNSDESEGFVKIIPEKNEIVGYNPVHRIYQGRGDYAGFKGYFAAKFNKPFTEYGVYDIKIKKNYQIKIT